MANKILLEESFILAHTEDYGQCLYAALQQDLIILEDVSKNKPERRTDKPSFSSVPVFQQLIVSLDLISCLLNYDADALQIYLSKAWHLL